MFKHTKQSGFTLIELMIASSLLMLIMYSGYFAYSLYSNSWNKQSNAYWQTADQGVILTSLTRLVESSLPFIVKDSNENASMYFIGENNSVSFVSSAPIYSELSALVELRIIDNQLIYRESSFENALFLSKLDAREWQHEVVLLNEIANASFSFYGWENLLQILNAKTQRENPVRGEQLITPSNYTQHEMETRRVLPMAISFYYTNKLQQEVVLNFHLPQNTQYALYRYIREDA